MKYILTVLDVILTVFAIAVITIGSAWGLSSTYNWLDQIFREFLPYWSAHVIAILIFTAVMVKSLYLLPRLLKGGENL